MNKYIKVISEIKKNKITKNENNKNKNIPPPPPINRELLNKKRNEENDVTISIQLQPKQLFDNDINYTDKDDNIITPRSIKNDYPKENTIKNKRLKEIITDEIDINYLKMNDKDNKISNLSKSLPLSPNKSISSVSLSPSSSLRSSINVNLNINTNSKTNLNHSFISTINSPISFVFFILFIG